MYVRHATDDDVATMAVMSGRVQAKLTASGSQQEFGPILVETVAAWVAAEAAYVLDDGSGRILGGVFVAPVTDEALPAMRRWGLADLPGTTYYLQKLMIEPGEQGRGLGDVLLEGVKALVLTGLDDTIVLDCWAGNETLRTFYGRAGFLLHGVFPAGTPLGAFEVAVFTYRRRLDKKGSERTGERGE